MAINARIDDLRKRLDKDPGSRLFAQLAEELRKDGDLGEAVRVAREGLVKHPAYPSARLTLGRALLDQGEVNGARAEFEEVLKNAADNILASRFLGECLEADGDLAGALARYDQTLLLAPGDVAVEARRRTVQEHLAEASRVATSRAVGETAIRVSEVDADELMEVETGHEAPGGLPSVTSRVAAAAGEAPIPLSEVEGDFELERPYEAPARRWEAGGARAPVEARAEATIELEERAADTSASIPQALAADEEEADLISPTLAELYFSQGFPDKALDVYRLLLERDPENERLRARVAEVENRLPASSPTGVSAVGDSKASRREAVQRTIVRLERFLAATRREAR